MEKVVNNLIVSLNSLAVKVNNLDYVLGTYHEWKKEDKKFGKYLREKVKELSKNRDSKGVSDK
jgi:hypothetical protein